MPTLFGQSYRKTGSNSNPIYFRDDQTSGTSSTLSSSDVFFGELSWQRGDKVPTDGVTRLNFTFTQDNVNDILNAWSAEIQIWNTPIMMTKPSNSNTITIPGMLNFNALGVSPVTNIYSRKIDGGTTSGIDLQVDASNKHELKLEFIGRPVQQAFWKNPVSVVITSSYKG